MSKYSFENCQIGGVGDNVKVSDVNFYSNDESINIEELVDEVEKIKKTIEQKENKSLDDYKVLVDILELEGYAKKNDISKVREKIKSCATKFLYDISMGVSGGILANLISKTLNI
ncbi:hypothetical protein ACV3Z4_03040 [Clostridium perfringens]|uniref:Uncharacterized protein n=1 Tax=Clostridium perfringens F262 TaxID=883064 RepID=A0AAV3FEF3_CLOPF|nr:hypothetical protein [Clostridium perfringens]EHK2304545.1 hypothetical protein [Clostridium perfringens]EIA17646.1 hypothetical protein HA1_04907 [Clostridium perfringens F262]EIF6153952.1 hypothetical protein [Clostridium perfringens]EJT6491846.1 hypothetical protein [Clostridium perfringens]ELC8366982.1 hypothetical protein [Clostridium perfringens]